jgi:hypothetical protein
MFSISITAIVLMIWFAIKGLIFIYPLVEEHPYILGAIAFLLFCWHLGDAVNREVD